MMNPTNRIERLEKISRWLDDQFEGPFGFRFGLDPLIGLIPVLGDALTSLISFYIVLEAYNMGCSLPVLFRMLFNIFLEDFLKAIPVAGQLFDFYWKSNLKNMDLLRGHLRAPETMRRNSTFFIAVLVLSFLSVMTAATALSIWFLVWLIRLF
jgi:hypothetical protein